METARRHLENTDVRFDAVTVHTPDIAGCGCVARLRYLHSDGTLLDWIDTNRGQHITCIYDYPRHECGQESTSPRCG